MIRTDDGKDIVEELREPLKLRPGTADCDVNYIDIPVPVRRGVLERAIAEIQFLRGMAGAVTQGESFADIKKAAR